jgi:hypothetical protein
MKKLILIIGVWPIFVLANGTATTQKSNKPVQTYLDQAVELVTMNASSSNNVKDFAQSLPVSTARKKEILDFLSKNNFLSLPIAKVTSDKNILYLDIEGSKLDVKVEYINKLNFIINNKQIDLERRTIEQVYQKVDSLLNPISTKKISLYNLMLPQAQASKIKTTIAVVSSALVLFGISDVIQACMGAEVMTITKCVFKDDASAIIAGLEPIGMSDYKCTNGNLDYIKQKVGPNRSEVLRYQIRYDANSKIDRVWEMFESPTSFRCQYWVSNGKIVNELERNFVCSDRGDQIQAATNLPLDRLNNCCKDQKCTSELDKKYKSPSSNNGPADGKATD